MLIFLACSCTKKDDKSEPGVTALPNTTDAARAVAPPSTPDAAVEPTGTARGPGEVDCANALPAEVITKHFGSGATLAYDPPSARTPIGYCRVTADKQTVLNANVSCGPPRWKGSIEETFRFEDHTKHYTTWPGGPGRAAWKNDLSDEQIKFIATNADCVVLLEFWAEVDRTALAKDVDAQLTPEVAADVGRQGPPGPSESVGKVPVPAGTACDDLMVMLDKIRRCEGGATLVDDLKPYLEDIQRWIDAGKPDDLRDSALGSCQALTLQLSSFAKEFGCAI